jgi:hypothetical protein
VKQIENLRAAMGNKPAGYCHYRRRQDLYLLRLRKYEGREFMEYSFFNRENPNRQGTLQRSPGR